MPTTSLKLPQDVKQLAICAAITKELVRMPLWLTLFMRRLGTQKSGSSLLLAQLQQEQKLLILAGAILLKMFMLICEPRHTA